MMADICDVTQEVCIANVDHDSDMSLDDDSSISESRSELDSHANMIVVGKYALVINDTGKTAQVSPFTPDYNAMSGVRIVDAAIQYDCPYSHQPYVLIVRNALHVPSMKNNLIPPFIMREAGIKVNSTPKIHVDDPTVDDHCIYFKEGDFRIPMKLHGIFSYFPTSKPTVQMVNECEDVYLLMPNGEWNPHSDAYGTNEDDMLDYEGNMKEKKDRQQILLSEIDVTSSSVESAYRVSKVEARILEERLEELEPSFDGGKTIEKCYQHIPKECDEVGALLSSVSCALDPDTLYARMSSRAEISKFQGSIGATDVMDGKFLDDSDTEATIDEEDESSSSDRSDGDDDPNDGEFESIFGNGDPMSGEIDLDDVFQAGAAHAKPYRDINAEQLSKVWRIDLETAEKTLNIVSQNCARTGDPSMVRNYSTNDRMLRYKRISEYFFMDTFFATKKGGKSSRGHTCCQLFVTDKGFVYVVPMRSKGEVLQAVKQFAKEVGAPDAIISDAAGEQKSMELRKFCTEIGTTLRVLEEGTPWANKAELYIGLIKEAVRKDMKEADCPLVFWDYCVERRVRIHNLTSRKLFQLHGTNPYTALTGEEGDISNLCQYKWYDWCYYREHKEVFPKPKELLGRVLGPTKGDGNEMAQWILTSKGTVVPRRTMRPLTVAEIFSHTEHKRRAWFDRLIERKHGTSINPTKQTREEKEDIEPYSDDYEKPRKIPDYDEPVDANGRLLNQNPEYDKIINAEVQLQLGDEISRGVVKRRAVGPEGKAVGAYDDNPKLNSMVYEVEFPDGQVKEYAANVIAENMLTQVDSEGFSVTLMEAIVDYRKKHGVAVDKPDQFVVTKRGQKRLIKSTKGWSLLVRWKDGSETWVPLADLKESHPVETAEFAKARGIDDEPAFAWWVPYTLRKQDAIIASLKRRIRKTTHKYGIEVPVDVDDAYRIDKKNGNHFWRDAIAKEMFNVGIAFEILPDDKSPPVGFDKVTGHMVFDVRMSFERKARWVLDGHKTPDPIGSTYAGVVSRDSVRIAFTYAALNGLEVCAADIRNAYLQAPSSQKHYIICGKEFGMENAGKKAIIKRALYGGKSAGRDYRNHLRACMRHLDFQSCLADPDVWMRPAKKSDNSECYEFCLLYTDDVLYIGEGAEKSLREGIGKYFELKRESIGEPNLYLGGRCRKVKLDTGVEAWAFGSSQYIQAAVTNVETYLKDNGLQLPGPVHKLPAKAETPMQTSYRPELDVSPELEPAQAAYYQSLIGILRWMVELGQVDICLEVSLMSSCLALPREGHLKQLLHIFAYLKKYHNAEIVFDPTDPYINESDFERKDWTSSEFGHACDDGEVLPPNMPQPRGMGFTMRAKVDADHAGDTVTRRSRTGFLVFLNSALTYWMSKKQTSVESSSFGSEFIAMKQCCEYIRGLRYKLRMMGIPVVGPTYIFGDNKSVLCNTSIPDSQLKKKSQSIAYHFIREGSARDEWRTAYVNSNDNEADLLTKVLPSGERRRGFVTNLLHHIFEKDVAVVVGRVE